MHDLVMAMHAMWGSRGTRTVCRKSIMHARGFVLKYVQHASHYRPLMGPVSSASRSVSPGFLVKERITCSIA